MLDYAISPAWRCEDSRTLATASEMDLRYDYFLGDIIFVEDECDFSARWGWVPVLDFALCLVDIVDELQIAPSGNGSEVFEFTESDAELIFERVGDQLTVSSTYSSGHAILTFSAFRSEVHRFMTEMVNDLVRRYPALGDNPHLANR